MQEFTATGRTRFAGNDAPADASSPRRRAAHQPRTPREDAKEQLRGAIQRRC
jgi:hypothetical protein